MDRTAANVLLMLVLYANVRCLLAGGTNIDPGVVALADCFSLNTTDESYMQAPHYEVSLIHQVLHVVSHHSTNGR